MANSQNYQILVLDNGEVISQTVQNHSVPGNTEQSKNDTSGQRQIGMVKAAVIGLAKRAVTDGLSRQGQYTGKRGLQTKINNVTKIAGTGAELVMGYAVGNIVGVGVVAAKAAYDTYLNYLDYNNEIFLESNQRDYLKSFALAINSNNRSKGNL